MFFLTIYKKNDNTINYKSYKIKEYLQFFKMHKSTSNGPMYRKVFLYITAQVKLCGHLLLCCGARQNHPAEFQLVSTRDSPALTASWSLCLLFTPWHGCTTGGPDLQSPSPPRLPAHNVTLCSGSKFLLHSFIAAIHCPVVYFWAFEAHHRRVNPTVVFCIVCIPIAWVEATCCV